MTIVKIQKQPPVVFLKLLSYVKSSHQIKGIFKLYSLYVPLHWVEVLTQDRVLRNTTEWRCRVGLSDIAGNCFVSAIGVCNIIRFFL